MLAETSFDAIQFVKVAVAAGFVTMPFLAYWAMLNWNFKVGKVSYAKAFNIVGALFSTILYSYYTFSAPKASLMLANLYWLYIPAVLCTVAYFTLFFLFRASVQKGGTPWVVPVAMLQYIIVLSVFAVLASVVLKYNEYYMVGGTVRLKGEPAQGEDVEWQMKYQAADGTTQIKDLSSQTDAQGRYLVSERWKDMPSTTTQSLQPVLKVHAQGASPYEKLLTRQTHLPWDIKLTPVP